MTKPDCETCRHHFQGLCVEPETVKSVPETIAVKTVAYCSQHETGTNTMLRLLNDLATQ